MEFIGYISLTIMGITLGLVGAGGSILTIPILVYLLNIPIILATSYSLVIVGLSALVAAIRYRHQILFEKAIFFIIPSVVGVFGARYFIIPNLPDSLGALLIDKALVVLLLIFMGLAGYLMIRDSTSPSDTELKLSSNKRIKVAFIGLSLGAIMGILGAGGGFLIIPTLVLLMGFTMQEAVPTSLFIITINSFMGFIADKHHLLASDWTKLLKYLGCALLGMLIGIYFAKFIKREHLKKAFGYFVWIIGIAILAREFIF